MRSGREERAAMKGARADGVWHASCVFDGVCCLTVSVCVRAVRVCMCCVELQVWARAKRSIGRSTAARDYYSLQFVPGRADCLPHDAWPVKDTRGPDSQLLSWHPVSPAWLRRALHGR